MIPWLIALLAPQTAPIIIDPVPVRLRREEATRALEEFESVCLNTDFDMDATAKAVGLSKFRYTAEARFVGKSSVQQRWNAPEAVVTLTLPSEPRYRGLGIPQCEVIMIGRTARTKGELLDLVRPLLSRHVSEPTRQVASGRIEWDNEGQGDATELAVADFDPDGKPTDSLAMRLSIYSADGRAFIEQIMKEQKPKGGGIAE